MNKSKQTGVIGVLVGAFMIYWAITHSPKAGIGQIAGNALSGSYTMSETWYYVSLAAGIAVAAFGLFKFLKGK